MACNKPIALYSALLLFLLFKNFSSHGQLLPIIDEHGGNPSQTHTYIVHVTKPEDEELLSDEDLEGWYKSFLPNTTLDSGVPRLVYSYRNVISGFAARLTPKEVRTMEAKDGFSYAQPDVLYHLETTYTHELLHLSQPFDGAWDGTVQSEGIVIGVIDSGILPTHPSFSDSGMPPPPLTWKGGCNYAGFHCNNKIIGAKAFYGGKYPTPEDFEGHGTHVASIAAGSFVDDAHVLGMAKGTAAGMAPKAHLAIYKVCYPYPEGCRGSDTLAAIDQAIADGVDVINMSIGGPRNKKLYLDNVAKGSLAAFKKGIFPCTAAGNGGPGRRTLDHSAPWVTVVGASSTDRRIQAIVKLGNGMEFYGESAYQPQSFNSSIFFPVVLPGTSGGAAANYCSKFSLNRNDVRGKVVICERGGTTDIEKGEVVYAAGGAAMILRNSARWGYTTTWGYTTPSGAHVLPAAQVSFMDGIRIKDYVLTSKSPTAAIMFNHTQYEVKPSPAVAAFSSRGPTNTNGGIVKPDVLAPGVNILGAWPYGVGCNPNPFDTKTFNFDSGTSMAAPHISGIAALIKYKHKHWSPAAIQSAIITSAKELDLDNNRIKDEANKQTADIYATGAGQVKPAGAMDPGLIYDLKHDDYISYLCGLGYNYSEIYWTTSQRVQCSNHTVTSPSQLNYPSIAVSLNSTSQTVERTVTNVGQANEVYTARLQEPKGVSMHLSTYQLKFSRLQQDKNFSITFVLKKSMGIGKIARGKLEWDSGKHLVTSPIAVLFS